MSSVIEEAPAFLVLGIWNWSFHYYYYFPNNIRPLNKTQMSLLLNIRESPHAYRRLVMLQSGVQAAHRWLPALRLRLCSSAGTKRLGYSPKIRLRIFGCQTSFWSWGKQACSVIHNSCIFKARIYTVTHQMRVFVSSVRAFLFSFLFFCVIPRKKPFSYAHTY